ncbi:MAG: efflux RND transporter periplasmic adaptor subunit [Bacteroidota bacterium]
MKYFYLAIFLVVTSLFLSCGGGKNADAKKGNAPPSVDVIIAGNEDVPGSIEANGTVLSEDMIELHAEISGRITYLNIPDGARVGKGAVLAKINDADLQAQLEQLKVELELATKTEQRYIKLLAVNGIDQATYDASLNNVDKLKASIKVISAQIDKTVIRAPFAGKLGLRQVSPGAYVTPATLIGTLQSDNVKIDFTVPEIYMGLVKTGNKVQIKTTASENSYTATISAVEPQINTSTRNIKVRARLESGSVNPGAFVKVMLEEKGKGIIVPTNAIIPDAQSNQVIVVKNGKGVYKNVETGIRTADFIEIKSGLVPGDSIVVSGVLFVRPNAKVKVSKVKKIADCMK